MTAKPSLIVRHMGTQEYVTSFESMKKFNEQRSDTSSDEIWLLEHQPVFTQGQAGNAEYILVPGDIPVVKSDRGGHVTFHGPGQITAYILVDLKRLKLGVRDLVTLIEQALITTLAHWEITAASRQDAPGVYVENGDKIASLGLRIRKGSSYHGLNLNVAMDMAPWQRINPCGLGVSMTQIADLLPNPPSVDDVAVKLADNLRLGLGYNSYKIFKGSVCQLNL
jgi:lipoyl(octanoyl) transferase